MSNATVDALLDNCRAKIAGVTDDLIKLELFNVIDEIAADVLREDPPQDIDGDPETWLPADKWQPNYQLLLDGVYARLYAQGGKPWASADLAKFHLDRFRAWVTLARSDTAAETTPTDIYNRLVNAVWSAVPAVPRSALDLVLFDVIDDVSREALRIEPPDSEEDNPADWLTDSQWADHYQTLLEGLLSRLYAQLEQPWGNADLARAHFERYQTYLALSRSTAADAPDTVYQRLLANIRVQLPTIRDEAIRLELYTTADKIRREALRIDALTDTDTDPEQWIPADKWDRCYQVLLYGTLYRLQAQPGKPWSSGELAAANLAAYTQELELLRNESVGTSDESKFDRIMDQLRTRLPGARDNVILSELFQTLDRFCKDTNVWHEAITFKVKAHSKNYTLVPQEHGKIVRLVSIKNDADIPVNGTMEVPGELVLDAAPSQDTTYTATVVLTVRDPVTRDGYPELPDWILEQYGEGLIDGVVGRMMTQLSKPYTNERMAVFHLRSFRTAISTARAEARRMNAFNRPAWRFPQGFSVPRR